MQRTLDSISAIAAVIWFQRRGPGLSHHYIGTGFGNHRQEPVKRLAVLFSRSHRER
jgi:hypothetical protein